MGSVEQYAPGAAFGAEVRKDGETWTLVLVRELRHPPATVWTALTDPEHLREWAPFDADRNLGTVGTAKLSTVGAPTPHVSETQVKRADAPKVLEFSWGDRTSAGNWSRREAAALGSRSGTTSTVASSRWALRAGTSASMCWIAFSPISPLDASPAPMP
jgi:uncharacterized protein YndB with AHSA1/START domain